MSEAEVIEEAVIEEIVEASKPKMTLREALTALRAAFDGGAISKKQYHNMRMDLGISQSTFTRKPFNRKKARAANKAAKMARKVTSRSFKGQKMHKGMKR